MSVLREIAAAVTIFTIMSFGVISLLPKQAFAASCTATCGKGGVTCTGNSCTHTDFQGCTSWDASGNVLQNKTCSGNGGASDPPSAVE